ncbi:DUF892 family protein [Flavobacterium selenitireducens]|uniref:DUF892 family protein n=1 Tax=Flavobacterium selenitireducens TaxID=2722704 RepID=UPI00168C046D|nr:DUF892 family protein [Flavobacterium selenitireducens]MBD3583350.1 DUF892 family protein [Flavobacterium selenitireducens]
MRTKTPSKSPQNPAPNPQSVSRQELSDRFDEELKRRYWSEKTLLDLLPNLEKTATSYELILALQSHARVTEHQIDRLLHIFDTLGERALLSKDQSIADLFQNSESAVAAAKSGYERDEAITMACRRIMQYEISVYEQLLSVADALDQKIASGHISQAITEEREAHIVFNQIELKSIYSD